MKVDPNQPIEFSAECILCEAGYVELYDGARTPLAQLGDESSVFYSFCQSLDPNKCMLTAVIPDDSGKAVFFKAREIANQIGLYMQALVDTPERHRTRWESYKKVKKIPKAADDTPEEDSVD